MTVKGRDSRDGHTNKISFNFQGHKVILKHLSPKEINEDQVKLKTKRENEKGEESKIKTGFIVSSPAVKTIMLTRIKLIPPPRYTSSLYFSLPNHSKYLTYLIKKYRDDIKKLSKGSHLLRGFSQTNHFLPKHSLQTWHVSRTHPCELPKLHEHKFDSQPNARNHVK